MTFAYCSDLCACECWAQQNGYWEVVSCFDRNAIRHNRSEWNSVDPTLDDQPIATDPGLRKGSAVNETKHP